MHNLVSIITPSYNCEKFISDTISSVLLQSYKNWEMLIVDDCSTDDSRDIINSFIKNDQRIKLISNDKNEGAAVSRNKAIKHSSGKYIAFLDSDDLWEFDKLEKQVSFMEANKLAFTYSDYELIDENGKSLNQQVIGPQKINYMQLLKGNKIGCLTAIYDKDLLGKQFMPLIRKRQDYGLWLAILKKEEFAIKVPGLLAKYRIRKNSVSSSKLGLLRYNYELFNKHEKLSKLMSVYYVSWNVFKKLTS